MNEKENILPISTGPWATLLVAISLLFVGYQVSGAAQSMEQAAQSMEQAAQSMEQAAQSVEQAAQSMEQAAQSMEQVAPLGTSSYNIEHCHVTCGTTATLIQCSTDQKTYSCEVDSAETADTFFGDSGVTTTTYGAKRAASGEIGGDVFREYCIVASGTSTLHCRSGIDR